MWKLSWSKEYAFWCIYEQKINSKMFVYGQKWAFVLSLDYIFMANTNKKKVCFLKILNNLSQLL